MNEKYIISINNANFVESSILLWEKDDFADAENNVTWTT